jgi:cell division protein FtsQ
VKGATTLPPRAGPPRDARDRAPRPDGARIDPRIRERRAGVLRSEARRRLRRALSVLAVLVLAGGVWGVLHSALFSARVVTVVGAAHTADAAVVRAAGLAGRPPLVDVDAAAAAAAVERLPWVARASVVRQWPDGVRITVVERTPVAAVALQPAGRGWAILDRSGRVLELVRSRPASLEEITATAAPGRPGSTARGLSAALRVAATLPAAFRAQVNDVAEARGGAVTLHLTSPLTVYLGSTSQLHQKYEDVAALLAGARLASGDVIDVSAPTAPVVRP